MERRPITADLVARVDRLLEYGVKPPTVACRLGISPYVIRLIVRDKTRYLRPVPPPGPDEPAPDPRRSTDAVTIRMIQRMLAINWLDYAEIAREAGVSQRLVERVAAGRRLAISTEQHMLDRESGEHAVRVPVRCPQCHAMISVVPCRACRVRNGEQEASSPALVAARAISKEWALLRPHPEAIAPNDTASQIACCCAAEQEALNGKR